MVASGDPETLVAAACTVCNQERVAALPAQKAIGLALTGSGTVQASFRLLTAVVDQSAP